MEYGIIQKKKKKSNITKLGISLNIQSSIYSQDDIIYLYDRIPVVPHKAVAEVSE